MNQNVKNFKRSIQRLYEDEFFVVFDKPSGLLVIPSPKKEKTTLVTLVNREKVPGDNYKLHPCHRLDRDTSGAIIFAKGKAKQEMMMALFKSRQIQKIYIAFVHGRVKKAAGTISRPIVSAQRKGRSGRAWPQEAVTKYKVLSIKKKFSVLEVYPVTGRTNQIRIHFSQIGHPLVGERKFAFARDFSLKFRRAALHASGLQWVHPIKKTKITVQSPLPNDMEVFIARNRN